MRAKLATVLGVALIVASGAVSQLLRGPNVITQSSLQGDLSYVESNTLLCPALDAGTSPLNGVVTMWNSSPSDRHVTATLSNGLDNVSAEWDIPAGTSLSINPATYLPKTNITLRATVDGGGVVGLVRTTSGPTSSSPCRSVGTTSWNVAGLTSKDGAVARIVVMNPSATPSVINVATWSSIGYSLPAPYQGLVVPAAGQVTLNLSNVVVEATDISADITVLRGRIVATAMQLEGVNGSLVSGSDAPSTTQWYPAVPTDSLENVSLAVMNPSASATDIRVAVDVPGFEITPLRFTVPGGASRVTLVPNSRIPSSGLASVKVTSRAPIVISLAMARGRLHRIQSPAPMSTELVWVGSAGIPDAMRLVADASGSVTFHYQRDGETQSQAIKVTAGQAVTPPRAWIEAGRGTITSASNMSLASVFSNTAFEVGLDARQ
jgi:hypothetical protein